MASENASSPELVLEATTETMPTAYELEVRQQKALMSIFGDEECATINYLNQEERTILLGELSLRYIEESRGVEARQQKADSVHEWHSYLRGRSLEDIAEARGVSPKQMRDRFANLRTQIRAHDMPFTELVLKAGGELIAAEDVGYSDTRVREMLEEAANDERTTLPACTLIDPEVFFPEEDDKAQIKFAKDICRLCVQRDACLEEALANGYEHGVWGGMSEKERRRQSRVQQAA